MDQPTLSTPAQPPGLRALTLNIGAASTRRATAILEWLSRREDDVVALTETSAGHGTALLADGLAERGYRTRAAAWGATRDRGVLLAVRASAGEVLDDDLSVTLPWRTAGLVLTTSPQIAFLAVYVPSRDRSDIKIERKRAFIRSLLEGLAGLPDDLRARVVILGDYNTVSRRHRPKLPGFLAFEYGLHDELAALGFAAAHELAGAAATPASWIGRTGTRYLYDYAHVGRSLHARTMSCEYLHETRDLGLSDHAAVALVLAPAGDGDSEAP